MTAPSLIVTPENMKARKFPCSCRRYILNCGRAAGKPERCEKCGWWMERIQTDDERKDVR